VHQIKNPGNNDHYCQFSGGGDLFITKKASSMVICPHDADHSLQPHRSPIYENEHMSGFMVEGEPYSEIIFNGQFLK